MYATVSDVYLSAVHARTWISHPNNAVEVTRYSRWMLSAGEVNFRINYLRKYQEVAYNATVVRRCRAAIMAR